MCVRLVEICNRKEMRVVLHAEHSLSYGMFWNSRRILKANYFASLQMFVCVPCHEFDGFHEFET
jgi:hypothetical protein